MNNSQWRWLLGLLAVLALVFTTGLKVKKKHFGADKTYAVITVQAVRHVNVEGPHGGAIGLFKSFKRKKKFTESADSVLKESLPMILEVFDGSKSFQLVPQEKVLAHEAYVASEGDKRKNPSRGRLLAEGYKYYKHKSEKKLKNLAKAMGVDGVIVMYVTYKVVFRGASAGSTRNPLMSVARGKQKGQVYISLWAYNADGDIVWKNTEWGRSEDGIDSSGGGTDFKQLRPFVIEAAKLAAKKQIEKLDEKVGG